MTPVLAQAWNQAMDIWTQGGRKASCDVWMPRMKAALTALGFPGEAALDSVAYQVMGALGEALGSFSALAPAAGKLGGRAAVRLLESVARTATFQPQRDRRRGWTCWACWRPRAVIGMGSGCWA